MVHDRKVAALAAQGRFRDAVERCTDGVASVGDVEATRTRRRLARQIARTVEVIAPEERGVALAKMLAAAAKKGGEAPGGNGG